MYAGGGDGGVAGVVGKTGDKGASAEEAELRQDSGRITDTPVGAYLGDRGAAMEWRDSYDTLDAPKPSADSEHTEHQLLEAVGRETPRRVGPP